MSPEDFNIEAQHQADTAISYLGYCSAVEQGGDEGSGKRDLAKDEAEARHSAIACVLLYLEKTFLQIHAPEHATNRKPSTTPIKKKSKKKST